MPENRPSPSPANASSATIRLMLLILLWVVFTLWMAWGTVSSGWTPLTAGSDPDLQWVLRTAPVDLALDFWGFVTAIAFIMAVFNEATLSVIRRGIRSPFSGL